MKKKLIVIIIILIIVLSLILVWVMFSPRYATKKDLELTITIEKETINKTKHLSNWVNVSLTNVGDEDVRIHKHFHLGFLINYNIETPSNKIIYPKHIRGKVAEHYSILSPNESLKTTVNIFEYDYRIDWEHDYNWNETGKYTVQFEYFISGYWNTYSKYIKSNEVEFWLSK